MDVSIIICTHNGADALGGTLESLRRIDVPSGRDVELLLVDNACLGRSEAYISKPGVRVFDGRKQTGEARISG